MAEFAMKDLVEKKGISDRFLIESAAAFSTAIKDGIGEPVNVYAQKAMEKYGIRCCEKRARRMEPSDYEKFDHIVVMDRKNIRAVDRYTAEDTEKKLPSTYEYGYAYGLYSYRRYVFENVDLSKYEHLYLNIHLEEDYEVSPFVILDIYDSVAPTKEYKLTERDKKALLR